MNPGQPPPWPYPMPPPFHGAPPPPCPFCGHCVLPVRKAKGSALVAVILLLLGAIPGLLYMVIYQGYIFVCPICRAKRGDAV